MSIREPGVHVEFVNHAMVHAIESKGAGREVCIDRPHVKVRIAGMEKEEFFGPVNDYWKGRFPEEWDAFQKGETVAATGTPVQRWPQLTPGQVKNLKALDFHTVEDVAAASDAQIQKIGMGANKLREEAQKFLSLSKMAADMGQMEELRESLAAKDDAMAAQAERMAAMESRMAEMAAKFEAEAPKKRAKVEAK